MLRVIGILSGIVVVLCIAWGALHLRGSMQAIPNAPVQTAADAAPQSGAGVRAGEWHEWRGPGRADRSSETGLLKQWPEGGPKLLWTAKGCGEGFASVVIGGGMIYTAGNLGENSTVVAFDLKGQQVWTAPCGKAWTNGPGGTRGTPTFDSGRVFYESPLGVVGCFDGKTGTQVWSVDLVNTFGARNITWGLSESVLIDGSNLVCCPGGQSATMVALDKKTGKTVWVCKGTQDTPGYASPIVVDFKGLRQIITMTGQAAIGVNAKTGELMWRYEHKTSYDANIPTPIFSDGYLFIDSGYGAGGSLLQIDVVGGKASAREVWSTKALDNHHGDVVLVDGCLYGSAMGGAWMCLDFKTGDVKYRDNGIGKGSVTYAEGRLYIMNEGGGVGLVAASPQGHQLVSRFQIPQGGQGPTWSHPVVCGGRLYLRHGDFLYSYDIKGA